MSWHPKNLNESLIPFSTLYAILGYGVFQYPIGRPRVRFSVVYAIIVTSIYSLLFALMLKKSFESQWFRREEKILYCMIYINFFIAVLAQILNFCYNKKFSRVIDRMALVDETLRELGATLDYTKCMKFGIRMICFWLASVAIIDFISDVWFYNELPIGEIIILTAIMNHPVHINCIVLLNFCLFISLIEMRFCQANKLLDDGFEPGNQRSANDNSRRFLGNKIRNQTVFNVMNNRILKIDEDRRNFIQAIKHVHLELTLIAEDLDIFSGVIILLGMAAYFVLFMGLLYTLYDMTLNPIVERKLLIRISVVTMWTVIFAIKLIFMNHTCEQVTAEAKRTGNIIHCIEKSSEDSESVDVIRQFSLQLMNNPLYFSPVGFFTLGYDFLRRFLGSVVTYLVILIQMSPDP